MTMMTIICFIFIPTRVIRFERSYSPSFPLKSKNYESYQRCLAYSCNIHGNSDLFAPVVGVSNMLEKISEIIPLVKEGDTEMPNCNRLISLLPAASKICERKALNQLVTYLDVNKKLKKILCNN